MTDVRTILCPVDFSPRALVAARKAALLGRSLDAQLVLLHVVDLIFLSGPGLVGFEPSQLSLDHDRTAREQLMALADELAPAYGSKPQIRLCAGPAHSLILDVAKEREASLIVMGRGQHGGLGGLLGRVAERVVRRAKCPVLICPADERADLGQANRQAQTSS